MSSVKTVMMPSTQDDQHGSFLGLVTGEPRETETLMRGRRQADRKVPYKVTRWRPSLLYSQDVRGPQTS
ncbi:hypothetical protein KSB_05010 [Ktedonobacter robiniae]|uniref:Uncharacterized protein n=1 Tax=Ktedonobacter robiniae TaxID=2778365 RepID=A0ABQ3UH39_9CHLR|nr:hypothetical protein KSB_05010 [Ktedonobacter robiniae]